MSVFNTIFLSLLVGVLPALLWLWFWLKEDRLHPEPKRRLSLVFIAGMVVVFLVLPIEKFIFSLFLSSVSLQTIIFWAATEEIFKFLAAYAIALRSKDTDEPLDVIIYMITAALGFSALENSLFLSNLIDGGMLSQTVITGNSRFLGATLLHVASSAILGITLAFSFYRGAIAKNIFLFTGIVLSIALHTGFNLLIIKLKNDIFFVFAGVWVLIILLILLIEKVKTIKNKNS